VANSAVILITPPILKGASGQNLFGTTGWNVRDKFGFGKGGLIGVMPQGHAGQGKRYKSRRNKEIQLTLKGRRPYLKHMSIFLGEDQITQNMKISCLC